MNDHDAGFPHGHPLLSAQFLAAAVILIVAVIGLRPALTALSRHYAKEPIDVRKPLSQFDVSRLPSFKTGWTASNIPPDDIETDQYSIVRLTREARLSGPTEVVLFVTYYSDPNSKVPHTPDVCYRQAGAVLKQMSDVTIELPEFAPCPSVKARLLLMQQQTYNQAIIFSFYVDGRFKNSREQVRWMIGKPGNRYVYFSKIETVASYPLDGDPAQAVELCRRLFSEAVPVLICEHFPTSDQLKR